MQTPDRFSSAIKAAMETQLPTLLPAVLRARFDFRETARPAEIVKTLRDLRHRGSSGVILKAPDLPEVVAEVDQPAGGRDPGRHPGHRPAA